MQNFTKIIDDELEYLKTLRDRCRKDRKHLPRGTLSAETKNGKVYYKIRGNDKKKRAAASDPLIAQIQHRKLLEVIEQKTDQNIAILEEVRDKYQNIDPFQCRSNLPKAYQSVPDQVIADLGFLTVEQFREKYQTDSQFRFSQRIHTLSSGEKVRSRIEVSIAEMYLSKGLEFVYEPIIPLNGNIVLHPDFAVLSRSNNRIWLHEHIGDLKTEKYREQFRWKMNQYTINDILPMRDLLFSFEEEDGNLDMRQMEKMINLLLI